jgi:hypothetical protein
MFVLHEVCVHTMVLSLNGQSSSGFDLGHNSPGRSEFSIIASMMLGLCSCIGYELAPYIDRGRSR